MKGEALKIELHEDNITISADYDKVEMSMNDYLILKECFKRNECGVYYIGEEEQYVYVGKFKTVYKKSPKFMTKKEFVEDIRKEISKELESKKFLNGERDKIAWNKPFNSIKKISLYDRIFHFNKLIETIKKETLCSTK